MARMVAQFLKPAGEPGKKYFTEPGATSPWLVTITQDKWTKIALAGGSGLHVSSNDPSVVPNNFAIRTGTAGQQVFELFGRAPGVSMIEARANGSVKTFIQAKVIGHDRSRGKEAWIRLGSPSAVMNAPNVRAMTMTRTIAVSWDWGADRIIAAVPKGIKHLVFNCHGFPTGKRPEFPAAHLSIGTTLHAGNVDQFAQLRGNPTLKVIWIAACNVADSGQGGDYCQTIARVSGKYVVCQETETRDAGNVPGQIMDNFSHMGKFYSPDAKPRSDGVSRGIWRGDFFALQRQFDFELLKS